LIVFLFVHICKYYRVIILQRYYRRWY